MPCIIFCSSSAAGPLPHPPPSAPFTPPRARAGRRRSGPAAQKGGRRVSFTLRPAPLPSRSGAMTPFPGCAAPPTHPKVMRRPPFPAPSSRPVDAPDRGGGGRRPGAPGAGAQHRRGRRLAGVARPHEAEKAPAEPARGGIWRSGRIVRAGTPDALGDFRMIPRLRRRCGGVRGGTILPEHQNRNPMGSAERPDALGVGAAPQTMRPPAWRVPRRARGRWQSSGAPARTDPDGHPAKDSTGHAR